MRFWPSRKRTTAVSQPTYSPETIEVAPGRSEPDEAAIIHAEPGIAAEPAAVEAPPCHDRARYSEGPAQIIRVRDIGVTAVNHTGVLSDGVLVEESTGPRQTLKDWVAANRMRRG
jgi:hypothetical protein